MDVKHVHHKNKKRVSMKNKTLKTLTAKVFILFSVSYVSVRSSFNWNFNTVV